MSECHSLIKFRKIKAADKADRKIRFTEKSLTDKADRKVGCDS